MVKFAEVVRRGPNEQVRYIGEQEKLPVMAIRILDVTNRTCEVGDYYIAETDEFVKAPPRPIPTKAVDLREFLDLLRAHTAMTKRHILQLLASTNTDIAFVTKGFQARLFFSAEDVDMQDAIDALVSEKVITDAEKRKIIDNWPKEV